MRSPQTFTELTYRLKTHSWSPGKAKETNGRSVVTPGRAQLKKKKIVTKQVKRLENRAKLEETPPKPPKKNILQTVLASSRAPDQPARKQVTSNLSRGPKASGRGGRARSEIQQGQVALMKRWLQESKNSPRPDKLTWGLPVGIGQSSNIFSL